MRRRRQYHRFPMGHPRRAAHLVLGALLPGGVDVAQCRQHAVDDVVHVREVPRQFALLRPLCSIAPPLSP